MVLESVNTSLLSFLFAALKRTEITLTTSFCGVFALGFGLFLLLISVVSGHLKAQAA